MNEPLISRRLLSYAGAAPLSPGYCHTVARLRGRLEAHRVQRVVGAAARHQLVVRPLFYNPARVQHDDMVRVLDRRQAMGTNDVRPVSSRRNPS